MENILLLLLLLLLLLVLLVLLLLLLLPDISLAPQNISVNTALLWITRRRTVTQFEVTEGKLQGNKNPLLFSRCNFTLTLMPTRIASNLYECMYKIRIWKVIFYSLPNNWNANQNGAGATPSKARLTHFSAWIRAASSACLRCSRICQCKSQAIYSRLTVTKGPMKLCR